MRSPFWGSKAAKVGVTFANKTSKTLTSQKPAKSLLDQEKSCWERPVWSYRFSSRILKIILSAVFEGVKLAISPARWDLGHEADPKSAFEIDLFSVPPGIAPKPKAHYADSNGPMEAGLKTRSSRADPPAFKSRGSGWQVAGPPLARALLSVAEHGCLEIEKFPGLVSSCTSGKF